MSQPRPLRLRLVRLAAGVAVALPAIGLYGATGAWADKPVSPGNSAAAHAANGNAAPAAPAAAPAAAAPAAPAADHVPPGQAKKAADAAAVAVAPAVSAAVSTAAVAAAAPAAAPAKPGNSDHSNGNASTVGDPTKPQPLSNADKNPGGANNGGNCGDYCSTRDGSPSMNGNGGGKANGKPCAGCVGKADNKNPPGQFKNGSDHNNGYECDGNHGIGKGNPAHTGCKPTPPPKDCLGVVGGHATAAQCNPPKDCLGVVGGHATAAECNPPKDCLGVVNGHATAAECNPPKDCLGVVGGHATAAQCNPPKDCLGVVNGHATAAECNGSTTGGTTGGTTGITTGGSTGAATSGGSTGISTGGGSGAETTGGTTCPTSVEGLVGPMPAGCHLGGGDDSPALPFTGLDAMVLVAVGAIAAGLGLALTAAGSMRRRPQA